jgi:hypothetical protein
MLYGFLGFRPRLDGCVVAPQLPVNWPSLTIRNIRLHDVDLEVTAAPGTIRMKVTGQPSRPLRLFTPKGDESQVALQDGVIEVTTPK